MKEFKKIVVSLLIVCGLLVFVDLTFGFCGDKLMAKLPNFGSEYAKDNYRLNRCDEDIIIIGPSSASHHYVASMLCDSLNMFLNQDFTIFNAGMDGRFLNYSACVIESIIERYTPKIIIWDLHEFELVKEDRLVEYNKMFYKSNKYINRNINSFGIKTLIAMQSSLYRMNGSPSNLVYSFLYGKDKDELMGYYPLYGEDEFIELNFEKKNIEFRDSTYVQSNLDNLVRLCNKKNINLIIVSSPRYKSDYNNYYLSKICSENGIPYIDLSSMDYFNTHPNLFKDAVHLNDEGAHIFTNMIFDELKPYLLNI